MLLFQCVNKYFLNSFDQYIYRVTMVKPQFLTIPNIQSNISLPKTFQFLPQILSISKGNTYRNEPFVHKNFEIFQSAYIYHACWKWLKSQVSSW